MGQVPLLTEYYAHFLLKKTHIKKPCVFKLRNLHELKVESPVLYTVGFQSYTFFTLRIQNFKAKTFLPMKSLKTP